MKRDDLNPDFTVDGKGYQVVTAKELDFMMAKASRMSGIVNNQAPAAILARLWRESGDAEQARIERRKENYGLDFKKLRDEAMKGAL